MTHTLFPVETLHAPSTRPISFTSGSIHGIDKDLKTQTRRPMYPQPKGPGPIMGCAERMSLWRGPEGYGDPLWKCPYGLVGDRLWVREVWARVEPVSSGASVVSGASGARKTNLANSANAAVYGLPISWRVAKDPILLEYWQKRVVFLADFPGRRPEECGRGASDNKWRSPVSMPRWASRRLLEVTEIRAERVQEIGAKDCQAEGIDVYESTRPIPPEAERTGDRIYRDRFSLLWDSINRAKNPWSANPWVWVISFRKIEKQVVAGSRELQARSKRP